METIKVTVTNPPPPIVLVSSSLSPVTINVNNTAPVIKVAVTNAVPLKVIIAPPLAPIRLVKVPTGPKGDKGDKGDQGDPGNIYSTQTAGENISGGKAVIIDTDGLVYVYDISNENHYGLSVGIAKTAATTGTPIDIFINGIATEVGSGWLPGVQYYVSSTGILSDTPPLVGINKLIAVGVKQDTVLITNVFEIITI